MADFAAVEVAFPTQQMDFVPILMHEFPNLWEQASIGGASAGPSYVMRAQDSGRPLGADYVTWEAITADFDGVGYVLGSPSPIGAMVVNSAVVMSTLTQCKSMGVRIQVSCDFCVVTEGMGKRALGASLIDALRPKIDAGWRVDSTPDGEVIGMVCPTCSKRMASYSDLPSE